MFQEIFLRGPYEMEDSLNPGGLRSLLNFANKLVKDVDKYLKSSKAF